MAYDENLADRVRAVLASKTEFEERKMFGGLAFMIDGKMCCGLIGKDLMVRVGPERYDVALTQKHVRPMDFTGKPMRGYVYVAPQGLHGPEALSRWVQSGLDHVRTLPRK